MMRGRVNLRLEPQLQVELIGANGETAMAEAAIDTRFTGELLLSPQVVEQLALPEFDRISAYLADGTRIEVQLYETTVMWHGRPETAIVHCLESRPLIGMTLLAGSALNVEAIPNGEVTVTALP